VGRIKQVFDRTVETFPDNLAVVEGDLRWNYAQLRQESQLLEGRLRNDGVKKGDRVVLWLKNSRLYIAAYLAVLGLEAVVVAAHPDAPVSEVLKIISHAEAIAVVTISAKFARHAEELEQSGLRFALLPESSLFMEVLVFERLPKAWRRYSTLREAPRVPRGLCFRTIICLPASNRFSRGSLLLHQTLPSSCCPLFFHMEIPCC
jgi:acyl-CoA synthetase (AMP-forming)/AMP-acid ligase II